MTTKHSIETEKFIDPICGMTVAPESAAGQYDFEGKTYYFCSNDCLNKFKQNPRVFLAEKKPEKSKIESEGVITILLTKKTKNTKMKKNYFDLMSFPSYVSWEICSSFQTASKYHSIQI